jgi:GH15 family glucan-1,4-alpha-glucosidase
VLASIRFAGVLRSVAGKPDNGRWQIAPRGDSTSERRYRGDTLISGDHLHHAAGSAVVVDFMPPRGSASDVVRIVRGLAGTVRFRTEFIVRFDYGSIIPWVSQTHDKITELHAVAGPDKLTLRTPVELHGEENRTVGEFEVAAGEEIPFVLTYSPSHLPVPRAIDVAAALNDTEKFWHRWSARCTFKGPSEEAVRRSLITLKALIYRPTGGIVAAATTSLPERVGGMRNWDYRYCWLRDATFSLLALMNAGYVDEAESWRDWLVRALAGAPAQAQIMYGLAGERRLTEWEVGWLPGFEESRPVRIGNAAAGQLQLDVYGEVADALHHARLAGLAPVPAAWAVQSELTDHVAAIWDAPDEGIWEVRGPRRHFTHSKVMAWVAIDRAISGAEKFGLTGSLDHWREVRGRIHADVCARGFNSRRGTFVQSYDCEQLDASLLMIPLVGFLPADDPRVRSTVEAIGRELVIDGLVHRYRTESTDDGLPPGEGAFLACSFWYVDNLVLAGRRSEALELFEHLLTFRNDLGLLAEEYDTRARRQLGNFPQAFSHVALVSSAYNLAAHERTKPAEQRSAKS